VTPSRFLFCPMVTFAGVQMLEQENRELHSKLIAPHLQQGAQRACAEATGERWWEAWHSPVLYCTVPCCTVSCRWAQSPIEDFIGTVLCRFSLDVSWP